MKQHVYVAAAALVVGILGIGSDVTAEETCTEIARDTARLLAQQYCETVKDAYADQVVIEPGFSAELQDSSGRLESECTRTHSLICKQRMADLVNKDSECRRLYKKGFDFELKDEFTGDTESTDSKSYYAQLQREGCKLH
jgi:hypothetical protein